MWCSMPKDDFEQLSALKKEHEQCDLLILQEQTRTRFIKDSQSKAEGRRKLLEREIVMAGDLLDAAKSKRSLLLEYQIQLTETQRISEKEVSQVKAEYAAILSASDAKKSEWTNKLSSFQRMYDESVQNVWSKYPGFNDYLRAIERREVLRQQLNAAMVAHNHNFVGRNAANSKLETLQKKKANLRTLEEQLKDLKERKNALAKTKDELQVEKSRRERDAVRRQQEQQLQQQKELEAAQQQKQLEEAMAARVEEERNDADKSFAEEEQDDSGINESNMNWTLPATSNEDAEAMVSAMTKTSVVEVPKQTSNFLSIQKQIGPSKLHHNTSRKVADRSFFESTPLDFGLRLSRRPMTIVPPDVTPIVKTPFLSSTSQQQQLSLIKSPTAIRSELSLPKTPEKNPTVELKLTPQPNRAGFFKAPQVPPLTRRSEKRSLFPPRNLMVAMGSNNNKTDYDMAQKDNGQPSRQQPRDCLSSDLFELGIGRKQAERTQTSAVNPRKENGQSSQQHPLAKNYPTNASAWKDAEGPSRQPEKDKIVISSNSGPDSQKSTADPVSDIIAWQEAEDSSQQPRTKLMKHNSSSGFFSFGADLGNVDGNESGSDSSPNNDFNIHPSSYSSDSTFFAFGDGPRRETSCDFFGNHHDVPTNNSMFFESDVDNDTATGGEEPDQSKDDDEDDDDGGFSFNFSADADYLES